MPRQFPFYSGLWLECSQPFRWDLDAELFNVFVRLKMEVSVNDRDLFILTGSSLSAEQNVCHRFPLRHKLNSISPSDVI